ncbi:hypothetical protein B4U80_05260 [Leptotrombidium deliense]|uniref:Uncharacterized protein n=1 Tax=Leptotrombidium deliense TaxID=299467 RepID=A0A443RU48_9ACAR|nr:hypothetical protein B4U80_05260 [Leptotrombidium deliense]
MITDACIPVDGGYTAS